MTPEERLLSVVTLPICVGGMVVSTLLIETRPVEFMALTLLFATGGAVAMRPLRQALRRRMTRREMTPRGRIREIACDVPHPNGKRTVFVRRFEGDDDDRV